MVIYSLSVVVMSSLMELKNWFFFVELSVMVLLGVSVIQTMFLSGKGMMLSDIFFVDSLSVSLISLSMVVVMLFMGASYSGVVYKLKYEWSFGLVSIMMLGFLTLSFLSEEPLKFYIYFEASLIPIFLMIMGWGYQPERLQAAIYMLFYTLFASLPLLTVILVSQSEFSSFIMGGGLSAEKSVLSVMSIFFFIFAFLVKLPMFFFHLWLPKAHVEAPVAGSMILAGVLLKLGSYGLWRVIVSGICQFKVLGLSVMLIGLVGGVVVSVVCFLQTDMKCLVAYSSVVHMGVLLGGMCSLSITGYQGALCLMIGHGLVSSGLFFLVGINYDRVLSRSLLLNKGMMVIYPVSTMLWFILSIFNISAPPSVSLLGEILLSASVMFYSQILFLPLMMVNFLGMVFTFYLYAQSQQGKAMSVNSGGSVVFVRELMLSWLHVGFILAILGFYWVF